ncbi:MAG TPA: tetratricopeptide repeat protein [Candidatus Binatia bacterium]
MKSRYTTREVAKILALPEWRIRSCVRAGFLSPARGPRRAIAFTFQDILLLKTTKGLLSAGVSLQRIRRVLRSLKRQLPGDAGLTNVTVYADGKRVVVKNGGARWHPDSGQFLFNFAARELAQRLKLPAAKKSAPGRSAEQWFELAGELEADSPEEARRAYLQALRLDPSLAEAHVNLGRLYHEESDFAKAEAEYRSALAEDADYPVAHYNLGVLLEERGRLEEAAGEYGKALDNDPDFADAHYHLALILEAEGKRTEALRHLLAARKLYLGGRKK